MTIPDLPAASPVTDPAPDQPVFTAERLAATLEVAQLSLTAERQAVLLDALSALQPALHLLRGAELGETPPATAFDAGWS